MRHGQSFRWLALLAVLALIALAAPTALAAEPARLTGRALGTTWTVKFVETDRLQDHATLHTLIAQTQTPDNSSPPTARILNSPASTPLSPPTGSTSRPNSPGSPRNPARSASGAAAPSTPRSPPCSPFGGLVRAAAESPRCPRLPRSPPAAPGSTIASSRSGSLRRPFANPAPTSRLISLRWPKASRSTP